MKKNYKTKPKKILFFRKEQLISTPNSRVKLPIFGNFTRAFFMSLSLCALVLFSTLQAQVSTLQAQAQTWMTLGADIEGEAVGGQSGWSVSLSADGNTVAIGAPGLDGSNRVGHVRVYKYGTTTTGTGGWTKVGDIPGEAAGDQSGWSVSLSADGNTVAIWSYLNKGNGNRAGHVRVYKYGATTTGTGWTKVGDIPGEADQDVSVWSVSLSADGQTVAIGTHGNGGKGNRAGHVRVYKYGTTAVDGTDGTTRGWTQVGLDIEGEAAGDQSGYAVSLSRDGQTVAIGVPGHDDKKGRVRLYQYNNGTTIWNKVGDIPGEADQDGSGYSVSLSANGKIVAIGAPGLDGSNRVGHVRVYKYGTTTTGTGGWTKVGDIPGEAAGDQSGWSVSLSRDGQTVAIGAPGLDGSNRVGHVRVYKYGTTTTGTGWTKVGDISGKADQDGSGYSVSLSANGKIVAIGAPYNDGNGTDAGHVRVYEDAIVITSPSTSTVAENNKTFSYAAKANRSNATFSLAAGVKDNARFTIDRTSGEIKFVAVPDFENPLDAGEDNVYHIQITATATDGTVTETATRDVAIRVMNVLEAPMFSVDLASSVDVQENTAITKPVYMASVSDMSTKEMVRFSLERPSAEAAVTADDDNAKFRIDGTSGEIKFMEVPDFENPLDAGEDNVYHIQITATAGTGEAAQTATKDVAITVMNLVEAPVFSSALASAVDVQENTAVTKPVYKAIVSDVSTKEVVTFSLEAPSAEAVVTVDDDNARFTIDRTSGEIKFVAVPDFENPLDAGEDNVYHIQITATATDGTVTETATRDVAIRVMNVLEAPMFSVDLASSVDVQENTAVTKPVYKAIVSDVSTKEVVTFSLEAPSAEAAVTVDDDNTKFTIDRTSGEIKFVAVPDFENPLDAGEDNVYHIQITATATDGTVTETATRDVAIRVMNVLEAPMFSVDLASSVDVQENTAVTKPVYKAIVSDVSTKEVVTFSLASPSAAVTVDDDNTKFTIDGTSGEIKFVEVPDFENPVSASGDNVYHIQITATAGTGEAAQTATKDVAITVTNVVEAPVFSSALASAVNVQENTAITKPVYTASVSDVSTKEVVTFSLEAPSAEAAVTVDDDNARFTIDRTSGEIKFVAVPDFENPLDAGEDNVYHIQITATATDGTVTETATRDVAIRVMNVLEAPMFSVDLASSVDVQENTAVTKPVYKAIVSDVSTKEVVTFSLASPSAAVTVDDDNTKFTIDGTSGEIKFVEVPDFENPVSASGDNVYHIQITATAGTGEAAQTATKDVAITVTNVVEAPVFSSALASAVNVQENTAITKPVYKAIVSDVSTKEVVTFSLEAPSAEAAVTVDDDNTKFTIDRTSGEIKFVAVPDFENPLDAGEDNVYHIQITATATDGTVTETATRDVAIRVMNVLEAPMFSVDLASSVDVQENTAVTKPVYMASVSDVSTKDEVTFSLKAPSNDVTVTVDDDNVKFTIDGSTGMLVFREAPDFENPLDANTDNVYHIQITATAGTGVTAQTTTKDVAITVTNLLEVPVFSSAATASVVENTPTTMTVYTASVSDVSTKEVVTFSLASPSAAVTVDDDNTKFTIDRTSGEIKFVEVPDFENPVSASGDNVYHIQITAKAGTGEAAQTATKDVAIIVTNLVEAPVFSSALASAVNVQENTAITKPVYMASVSDMSTKEVVTFSLEAPSAEAAVTVDDDNAKFRIDGTSGEIKFMEVPDFENPLDAGEDNVYHIQITATAGTGEAAQTATKDVAITVMNLVEAPVFSSALASAVDVQENTAVTKPVYKAIVSDVSTKEVVTFSLEAPSAEAAVTVDDDNARFTIDRTSGEIKFVAVPDFENPLDAGEDNVYHIQITATATDGTVTETATRDVAIRVMNVLEAPMFSVDLASSVDVQENTAVTKPVYKAIVSDVSTKEVVTFSLASPSAAVTVDDDNTKFTIDGTSGEIKFVEVPDFENPVSASGDNVYHIQITATAGTGEAAQTATKDVAITVTNVVEAPVFSSALASAVNVQENTAITKPVYTASVSDVSTKEVVTFSLASPSAAVTVDDDNTKFTIDRTSGEIKFMAVPDFENPLDANTDNVYHIQITAKAGTGEAAQTATKDVAIIVTNVVEAPVFSSALASAVNVQENTAITKPVYMASVSDMSTKEMVRFSLERPSAEAAVTADDDNAKFRIDGTSGEIKFMEVPDFENPLDAGEDNVYHIQITATAGTGEAAQTATKDVAITVMNLVEAPVFSSALASAVDVQENTAVTKPVYKAIVSDVSTKEVVTFSLEAPSAEAAVTVDDDNARFTIDRTSGEIKFVAVPDFENPLDAGEDNVYHIQITATATDGTVTETATRDVAIRVMNVLEAPMFSVDLASSVDVQENTAVTKPVYKAIVSDVSTKEVVTFSLEAPSAEAAVTVDDDNTKFTIDRTSGEIKFVAVPDFENPLDAGEDNVYHIQITATATDGTVTETATRDVAIRVMNVLEAPMFSVDLASSVDVQENTAVTKPVYMASVSDVSTKDEVTFSLKAPSNDVTVTVDDDNVKFTIDGSTGMLVFREAPDFENPLDANTDNVYHIQITATAGTGVTAQTTTKDVAITVTNLLEVPVFSSAATASVVENTPTTMTVYTASVSDVSTKEVVTFSLASPSAAVTVDDDNTKFTIDRTSGEIKFMAVPDFENPLDANTDNVYHIQITATAGTSAKHQCFHSHRYGNVFGRLTHVCSCKSVTKDVVITVTDVDDAAPVITSSPTATVAENTTDFTYTITASGMAIGEAATFALGTAGGDEAHFKLTANKVSFKAAPDFEMPKDTNKDNVYKLELKATDAAGNEGKKVLFITVTDVAEQGAIFLPELPTFADTKVGETLVKDLTISNTGNATLNITAITYPAGFMGDWTSGEIAAGGQKVVKITFKPTEVKAYTGTITIASDAANAAKGGTGATEGKNTLSVSGKGVLVPGEPEDVFLFPNPAADVLNIKLPNLTSPLYIQLVDLNGQVVYEQDAVATNKLSIDVSGYRSGVYALVLQTRAAGGGSKVVKRKVVIR